MFRQILRHYLPLAGVATAVCALAYLLNQQTLRLGANSPQVQLAQDAATRLAAGEAAASVAPAGSLDVGQSQAAFVIVFDEQGNMVSTTGLLQGQPPAVPAGVFDYVRENGEGRISWQPEPAARYAAVVERVPGGPGGFVLAARSLRETERTSGVIGQLTLVGWLATLGGALVLVVAVELLFGGSAPQRSGSQTKAA